MSSERPKRGNIPRAVYSDDQYWRQDTLEGLDVEDADEEDEENEEEGTEGAISEPGDSEEDAAEEEADEDLGRMELGRTDTETYRGRLHKEGGGFIKVADADEEDKKFVAA